MKTRVAGPGGVYGIGAVLDAPEKQARQLVSGGYAEALEKAEEPIPEPAPEPEKKQPKPKRK